MQAGPRMLIATEGIDAKQRRPATAVIRHPLYLHCESPAERGITTASLREVNNVRPPNHVEREHTGEQPASTGTEKERRPATASHENLRASALETHRQVSMSIAPPFLEPLCKRKPPTHGATRPQPVIPFKFSRDPWSTYQFPGPPIGACAAMRPRPKVQLAPTRDR